MVVLKSDRCSKKKVPPTTNTTVAGKNTKSMPDLIWLGNVDLRFTVLFIALNPLNGSHT